MPTTVALVAGTQHSDAAKKLIDFLLSKQAEQKLIDLGFAKWSVRAGPNGIKAIDLYYRKAAEMFPVAEREGIAILQGRNPRLSDGRSPAPLWVSRDASGARSATFSARRRGQPGSN